MKILQICPPWIDIPPSGYGGTELVIFNLVEGLIKEGHDVTLFATGNSKTNARLHYVFKDCLVDQNIDWLAGLPPLIHYNEAFKFAREYDFDIVHTHLSSGTDLTMFPYLAELEIPHVTTIHGHWPYDRFSNMDDYFLKYYGDKISIINISKVMEKFLPKELNSLGSVYNGIDIHKIRCTTEYKKSDYLTWVGLIVKEKGLHEAIQAVKMKGERMVFGGLIEPKRQKDSVEYFETMIKPHIDGDQIRFLGQINFEQKVAMLCSAKGFLNPIDWEEPFGMVMIEAMSCGTPVIAYARGAAKELVVSGKTGFLVNNVNEMADAIDRLNEINRTTCRERVEKHFSCEAMVKGYIKMYNKRIAQHEEPSAKYIRKNKVQRILRQRLKSKPKVTKVFKKVSE